MKNSFDNATYENEFRDLQVQVHAMSQQKFNGVSLFAQFSSETAGTEGKFGDLNLDNTVSVYVSADGTAGAKVSVNKALLLSALTIGRSQTPTRCHPRSSRVLRRRRRRLAASVRAAANVAVT